MAGTVLGIDFSGGAGPWRARVAKPTVWIAEAASEPWGLRLLSLRPVQDLPGSDPPFQRLVRLLAAAAFDVAAIDAPLCIPERHWPPGGREALLRDVLALPDGADRPFPTGPDLIALAERTAARASPKPLRDCEQYWRHRGVNARSTLWWTPRGGAPFAASCLALVARCGRPCWPWSEGGPGLLAETFPAGQLRHWGLPHQGYGGPGDTGRRRAILEGIRPVVRLSLDQEDLVLSMPDALDAVLCTLGAHAVATGRLGVPPPPGVRDGWIAVLERPAPSARP